MGLLTITEPAVQVTYNTIEDQNAYNRTTIPTLGAETTFNSPNNSDVSIYLSRSLTRFMAGANGDNKVFHGIDATLSLLTLNTNTLTFDMTSGLMMIDTSLIEITSADTISSPSAAALATGDYVVSIWANYSFSTLGTSSVTYSSYVSTRATPSTTLAAFSGTEKILLALFDVHVLAGVYDAVQRVNARLTREVQVHTPSTTIPMENELTILGVTYIVRGETSRASQLAWQLLQSKRNIFILDSYIYKPFNNYLYYEVAGIFSP